MAFLLHAISDASSTAQIVEKTWCIRDSRMYKAFLLCEYECVPVLKCKKMVYE